MRILTLLFLLTDRNMQLSFPANGGPHVRDSSPSVLKQYVKQLSKSR